MAAVLPQGHTCIVFGEVLFSWFRADCQILSYLDMLHSHAKSSYCNASYYHHYHGYLLLSYKMVGEHTVNSGHLEALALFTGEVSALSFPFAFKLTLLSKIQKSLSWKQEMHTNPDGEDILRLPLIMWEQSVWLPHLHHHLIVKHGAWRKWLLAGYIICYCAEDPVKTWPVQFS